MNSQLTVLLNFACGVCHCVYILTINCNVITVEQMVLMTLSSSPTTIAEEEIKKVAMTTFVV